MGRHPPLGPESVPMVVVMGIDPGLANTGFGIVRVAGTSMSAVDGGVIETPSDLPPETRLGRIHAAIAELMDWHEPVSVGLEDLYFGKNVKSALAVGQARGVAMLAAAERGARVLRLHASGREDGRMWLWRGCQGAGPADGWHAPGPTRSSLFGPCR